MIIDSNTCPRPGDELGGEQLVD